MSGPYGYSCSNTHQTWVLQESYPVYISLLPVAVQVSVGLLRFPLSGLPTICLVLVVQGSSLAGPPAVTY